ncbi:hypothetical protein HY411_01080 [Candidatus Gottesmanbacteria bacterium]|nr:hypothetical protein [Candidatus Gottesmanbacteria bacterium]
MTNPADYQRVVTKSKLLNQYQKEAFLNHPNELPQDFKQDIINLLTGFDERSKAREQKYKEEFKKAFDRYRLKLQILTGVSDEERVRLVEESDKLEAICMSKF